MHVRTHPRTHPRHVPASSVARSLAWAEVGSVRCRSLRELKMRGSHLVASLAALAALISAAEDECCWCDESTPDSAKTTIGTDSQVRRESQPAARRRSLVRISWRVARSDFGGRGRANVSMPAGGYR